MFELKHLINIDFKTFIFIDFIFNIDFKIFIFSSGQDFKTFRAGSIFICMTTSNRVFHNIKGTTGSITDTSGSITSTLSMRLVEPTYLPQLHRRQDS